MSDNKIINALECCMSLTYECDVCPYKANGCSGSLMKDTINLINSQKEKIEKLQSEKYEWKLSAIKCADQRDEIERLYSNLRFSSMIGNTRTEAIKEFAERLTKKVFPLGYLCDGDYPVNAKAVKIVIDNLVKEMTEVKL